MRNIFIVLTIVFGAIGIAFTILPMGTLAFLPAGTAILLSIATLFFSKNKSKKLPKVLLIFTVTLFLAVVGKNVLVSDKVAQDTEFLEEKEQSLQEAQKDLEEIEGLE